MAHRHLVHFPDLQDLGDWIRLYRTALRVSLVAVYVILIATAWITVGLTRFAGYELISSRGNSMEPTFPDRSLLLGRTTGPENVRVGDIITFPAPSEDIPYTVHRVVDIVEDQERRLAITQGDNNPVPDPELVPLDRPVIRVGVILPHLGWWLSREVVWSLYAIAALVVGYYLRQESRRLHWDLPGVSHNSL